MPPQGVFAFEVAVLIRAECDTDAYGKLHRALDGIGEFWIAEGEPPTPDEEARVERTGQSRT